MEKPSIFISYSSKDRETAEIIHQRLESAGFDVWRDKTRLETDWSREIAQALADRSVICLLWSKNAAQSKWVKHEWLTARALERTIILCRLPEAPEPPKPLYNLHNVSLECLRKGSADLIGRLGGWKNFSEKYDYTVVLKKFCIPFNRNSHFTGRGEDLFELYLKLIGNLNKIGINQVGTVGMGGIGKTQLVVEFACRFSFAFHSVHWIQAADEDKWCRPFVELARDRLQLPIVSDPEKHEVDKQYIYALDKYCKEHPNMLIIVDNVVEPMLLNNDSIFYGLTPLTLHCNLLFTTRKHFRLPEVSSQAVNVLSPESSLTLLTSYRTADTPDEETHAAAICNAVGYLPLAIILSGAYLRRYGSDVSFVEYHSVLLKNKLDTIDIAEVSDEELATRHIDAVTTTLASQWQVLEDVNARSLLKLAGQFPEAEIIPKARLGLLAGIEPGKSILDKPLARAFNLLKDLNLAEILEGDTNAIRLHPLVRAFCIRLLPEQQRAIYRSRSAKQLGTAVYNYSRLDQELERRGIQQILGDMEVAIDWWGEDAEGLRALKLLYGALRLSFNQLQKDTDQLATHLFGRLAFAKAPGIKNILDQAAKENKGLWLRPLTPSLTPPDGPLIRTLEGHDKGITAVAIAPDGKIAVSASNDMTLRVWNLHTGGALQTLEGHIQKVTAVALAPDGKTAVSASWDKTLKVWDLQSGEVLQTLEGHSQGVSAVAIAPDGETAVSACVDKTLKVWDLQSGEVLHTLEGHRSPVTAVAITPDGKIAVSASRDKTLRVWRLQSGEVLKILIGQEDRGPVNAVAITPDGNTAVSGSMSKNLTVWDLKSGNILRTLQGNSDSITAVAIALDGIKAVTASRDKTLTVWDLSAGEVLKSFERHNDWVSDVAITPDNKIAVSASGDKTLKVWNLQSGEVTQTVEGHSKEINAIAISRDGNTAVSASWDQTVKVWDLHSGEILQTLEGHSEQINAVAIAPDGKTAVSASRDMTLKVWDLHTGKIVHSLTGYLDPIHAVAISPDGETTLSASWHMNLIAWDLHTGEVLEAMKGHSEQVISVAIAPDGKTAVLSLEDKTLKVLDLRSSEVLQTLVGDGNWISAVAVTPDGKTAVSAADNATLTVWDLNVGIEVTHFYGEGNLSACDISPNGESIVVGEASGQMHFTKARRDGLGDRIESWRSIPLR